MQYEFWEDYEILLVETPENLQLRIPLAGFGPRFVALLIDTVISGVAAGVVLTALLMLLIGVISGAGPDNPGALILLVVAIVVISLLLTYGYYILFEQIWQGQTPGKRIAGIRVIKRTGQPLEFRDVVLRNILRIVDALPTYYIVGLVTYFATKHQQRLGDIVADTVVVREFTRPILYPWAGAALGQLAGGQLSPRHSYIIGSYLSRARELPVEYRLALTDTLIRQLGHDPGPYALAERDAYLASVMQHSWGGGQ